MFNWFAEDPSSEEITTLPNANINTSRTKGGEYWNNGRKQNH